MTEFAIYGGVDHRHTVGKVAPGLFAQEGRCWRMVYENPVGQSGHCMEPVAWVGRWKFLKGGRRCGPVSGTLTSWWGLGASLCTRNVKALRSLQPSDQPSFGPSLP
jgi:hypothetical protein